MKRTNCFKVFVVALLSVIILVFVHFCNSVNVCTEGCVKYPNMRENVRLINAIDDKILDDLKLGNKVDNLTNGSLIISKYEVIGVKRQSLFSHFVRIYIAGEEKDNLVHIYSTKGKIYFDERYNVETLVVHIDR